MATPRRIEYGPFFIRDLENACDWYSQQSQDHVIDLSEKLMVELVSFADLIAEAPEQWTYWDEEFLIRRCRLKIFPYSILYWIPDSETVEFLSFAHAKRNPENWISR